MNIIELYDKEDKGTVLLSREDNGIAAASILSNGETTISVMFLITHYIWGPDRVLAKIDKTTNTSYYYLYNGHGDVVQILDTSGTIKNTYDYDV